MADAGVAAGDGNTPGGQPANGEGAAGADADKNKKGKKKKDELECGENGTYGDLKKKTGKGKFDRDHVPSKAALKERARNNQKTRGGKDLCPDQLKAIEKLGNAIAIPKEIHSEFSPTYGGRNTQDLINKNAGGLQAAAKKDTDDVLKGMEKKGVSEECRKKYAKWAEKISNITDEQYDEMLQKAVDGAK